MVGHIFTAELWDYEADQPGSWHFLTLPMGVADDLSADAGPRRGFGSIRVEARMGTRRGTPRSSRTRKAAPYLLPVKKQVRLAEDIEPGSTCEVALRLIPS